MPHGNKLVNESEAVLFMLALFKMVSFLIFMHTKQVIKFWSNQLLQKAVIRIASIRIP